MINEISHTQRWLAFPVLAVVMLAALFMSEGLDPPRAAATDSTPNCKKTENAGACGTSQNIGAMVCGPGQPTCYQLVLVYGNIFNCIGGQPAGLTNCATGTTEDWWCKELKYTYSCQNGVCTPGPATITLLVQNSSARGDACGNQVGGP